MTSKLTIRSKFAAALAVPLAALAALAGVQARDAWTARDDARIQADLATSSLGPSGVITALQNERNFQSLRAIGLDGAVELAVSSEDEAVTATDFGRGSFRDSLENTHSAAADVYLPALGAMEGQLDGLRETADGLAKEASLDNAAGASDLFDSYTDLIDNLLDANDQIPVEIDDSSLRTGVELLGALSRQNDVEARIVREGSVVGLLQDTAAGLEARRLTGVQTAGEDRIRNLAQGEYQRPVRSVLDSTDRANFVEAMQGVADAPLETNIEELLATVPDKSSSQLRGAQQGVGNIVSHRAADVRASADSRVQTYGMLAIGAVLLAILVLALANLWITRPLRRLAREARAMADERLPEAVSGILATPRGEDVVLPEVAPVRVRGGAEVAGVVDALNQVQESALELAAEQALLRRNVADSFVNLGRRNQNLLGRQIELISQLEADEQNADELESLFRLDHLATRMRRNAESLLVLAGEEPARQWSEPVDVGDVVRAALGEVEQYRRVRLRTMDDATISGRVVADVSHMIAELLDNALSFSPPASNVDVWGRRGDTGYVLTVGDHGIGMPEAELAQANQRLLGAESFTVAPSRDLGHYVVAQLAERHGIAAELGETPGGGVSATVVLPPALVEDWVYDEPPAEVPESAVGVEVDADAELDADTLVLAAATGVYAAEPEWIAPAQSLDEITGEEVASIDELAAREDLDEEAAAFTASFADLMAAEPVELPDGYDGDDDDVDVDVVDVLAASVIAADDADDDTTLFDFDAWAPVEADEIVEAEVVVEAAQIVEAAEVVEAEAVVEAAEVVEVVEAAAVVEAAEVVEAVEVADEVVEAEAVVETVEAVEVVEANDESIAADPHDPVDAAVAELLKSEPPAVVFPGAELIEPPARDIALAAAIVDLVAESATSAPAEPEAVVWTTAAETEPVAEALASESVAAEPEPEPAAAELEPESEPAAPFSWAGALLQPRSEVPPEREPQSELAGQSAAEPTSESRTDLARLAESELTAWAADSATAEVPSAFVASEPELAPEPEPVAEAPPAPAKKPSQFRFDSEPYAELVALSDPNFVPDDSVDVSAFAPRDDALPELAAFVADATPESAAPPADNPHDGLPEWSAPEPIARQQLDEAIEPDTSDDAVPITEPVASHDELDGSEPVRVDTDALAALDDVHVESVPTLTAFEPGLDDLLPQQLPKRGKGRRSLPRRSRSAPSAAPVPASPWVAAPDAPAALPQPAPEPHSEPASQPEPAPVAATEPEAAPGLPRRHADAGVAATSDAEMPSMAAPSAGFEVPDGADANGNGDGSHESATPEKAPPPSRADFFAAFYAATERGRAEATPGERGTQ